MEPDESRRVKAAARRTETRRSTSRRVVIGLAVAGSMIACFALGGAVLVANSHSAAPSDSAAAATATEAPTVHGSAVASGPASSVASFLPSPTAVPTPVPKLPSMLAAIGDSYSRAFSVSRSYLYDHPQFSWVVGTARGDGTFSLYERFRALGAAPEVVDAATSGRKMDDAPRQANLVVAAARKLRPGQTAYVTFELGTNDLCDDPKTDVLEFKGSLQAAVATLEEGLPDGSRVLMLPVPDFPHFHDITQADPAARAAYKTWSFSNRCAPFLGSNSPSTEAEATAYLDSYDKSLEAACAHINATARLRCTYDAGLTADGDFVIGDLSKVDYFHPSAGGQAKMAENAWKADAWAGVQLPADAAQ